MLLPANKDRHKSIELWEGLSSEVEAPNPSKSRIRLYLEGLGSFVKDTGKYLLVEIGSKLITDQLRQS